MPQAADARLRRAVEIRLRHRLDDFSRDLEKDAAEAETTVARGAPSLGSSFLARDALAARSTSLIERHAERVLADLAAFSLEAADPALGPWFVACFEAHLDQILDRTLATLSSA